MARDLSAGQRLPQPVSWTVEMPEDFANVTALSWPGVRIHPLYARERDFRRLKAALQDDLMCLSFEELARVSWVLGSLVEAK